MRTLSLSLDLSAPMKAGQAMPRLLLRLLHVRPQFALPLLRLKAPRDAARDAAPGLRARAVHAGAITAAAGHDAALAGEHAVLAAARGRRALSLMAFGAAAGALAMYYMDPHSGRRRRALVRDRAAHAGHVLARDLPRGIGRRGRFFRGRARGVTHEAAELVRLNGHHAFIDDETLVSRVRSEALRDARVRPGEINIDAYEGCVTLRGQVESQDAMHGLVRAVRQIEGVTAVRSYLHLPGTLPPNKAEAIAPVPVHMQVV